MAGKKKKPRAKPDDQKIVQEIQKLHDSLHLAYCTALSIQRGLRDDLDLAGEDIGRCMQHHVVEELWRIGEQFDFILMDLGGKPRFMPIENSDD